MVLYVTRASETGGVFRFTLGAFSHVQRKPMLADSEVVKWMSQWRHQSAVPPVNTAEINHSSSRTVFPSNLVAQRCFSCMLLSGLFHQVVEHQASYFRNMFTSSLCLHFGGLLRFYLVGKNHWFLPCRKDMSFGPFWLVVLHKRVWMVWGLLFTVSHDAGSLMTHLTDKETELQQHSSVLVPTTEVKEMTFNYHDLVLGG